MAFNKLHTLNLDKSDMACWAGRNEAIAFNRELLALKESSFRKLIKEGEKNHSQNVESYKAYDKILQLFEEAKNL